MSRELVDRSLISKYKGECFYSPSLALLSKTTQTSLSDAVGSSISG